MAHLPIIVVATALRPRASVIVVLVVVVLVKVLPIVVGWRMVLRRQWSDVVVIILGEIVESLLELIERSLVAREEVLLLVEVVHEGLHGMWLSWSVPHIRIVVPIVIHNLTI